MDPLEQVVGIPDFWCLPVLEGGGSPGLEIVPEFLSCCACYHSVSWIGDLSGSLASLIQPCMLEGGIRPNDAKAGQALESWVTVIKADCQDAKTESPGPGPGCAYVNRFPRSLSKAWMSPPK